MSSQSLYRYIIQRLPYEKIETGFVFDIKKWIFLKIRLTCMQTHNSVEENEKVSLCFENAMYEWIIQHRNSEKSASYVASAD